MLDGSVFVSEIDPVSKTKTNDKLVELKHHSSFRIAISDSCTKKNNAPICASTSVVKKHALVGKKKAVSKHEAAEHKKSNTPFGMELKAHCHSMLTFCCASPK